VNSFVASSTSISGATHSSLRASFCALGVAARRQAGRSCRRLCGQCWTVGWSSFGKMAASLVPILRRRASRRCGNSPVVAAIWIRFVMDLDPVRYAHVRRELGLEVEGDKSLTFD
jgi:hypothetical protein